MGVLYIFMKISHNLNYRPPVKTMPKSMSKQPSLLGISMVSANIEIYRGLNPTLAAIMVQGAAELEFIVVKPHAIDMFFFHLQEVKTKMIRR